MNQRQPAGRTMWAALHVLDRQIVDPEGRMAGCVDDLELTQGADGSWYVSAIVSGPGALAYRLGWRRLGSWLRRMHTSMSEAEGDPDRIPFSLVVSLDSHVSIAVGAADVGSAATERWFNDHVVGNLPGSGHAPE